MNHFISKAIKGFKAKNADKSAYKHRYKAAGLTWFEVKKLKHIAPDKKRQFAFNGKKLVFINGVELLHALKEIFVDEIYKIDLPAHAKIIDCGANIGLSVLYLKDRFPNAMITAFEPDRINYELLKENVAAYDLKDVTLKNEAVWDKDETLFFEAAGQAGKILDTQTAATVEVKAIRLREYLNEQIDFLKIDIEGAEYRVIKDISDRLQHVDNLFIEYHGKFNQVNELVEILDIVEKNGFTFYIKEAAPVYRTPFLIDHRAALYDIQLNICCMKKLRK